ncbi:MAG TPA: T9SS type A sorting domain-containing protein [Bacteroidales bacterium]|nr:T9SS type A sorting domain-containing protein [Bacteroidales bacterium]
MKIYLLLLFLAIPWLVKAQYKTVFGDDTTQWNIIYTIPDYFPINVYKAYDDTIIGNKSYLKVFKSYQGSAYNLFGYLKEDTSSGKLWFRSMDDKERLIMDLSLKKTDTFYFGFDDSLLYTVDTIFYYNGKKHNSFNGESNDSIQFIEGIGPFNLFYFEYVSRPYNAQIRCMKKDNQLVYMNSGYTSCQDIDVGINANKSEQPLIFPNPATHSIKIKTRTGNPVSVEVFSSTGLLILKTITSIEKNIGIDCLPAGIYIVRIREQGKYYSAKLYKE